MSEALHQLIQSLDKTEKSYFKKFAHKSNYAKENYYKLFDSIEKQDHYNEKLVLKKNPYIKTTQQLSAAKNYLYRLILNSLCDYNKKKSIRAQLHQQLEQIEILCSKDLPSQAKKILIKAKKTAIRYELFPYLMQLQKWDEEISRAYFNWADNFDYDELKFTEESHTIEQWKNYRQYRQVANEFIRLQLKQEISRVTDAQKKVKQLTSTFLIENKTLSNSAESIRYYIQGYLARMVGDSEAEYQERKEHFNFLEQATDFREIRPLRYLSILVNLSANSEGVELLKYLELLEKFNPKTFQATSIKNTFLIFNWLLYYANAKNTYEYLEEIHALGEKVKSLPKLKNTEYYIKFVYLMMYNYFSVKEYHLVLEWATYCEQHKNKDSMKQYILAIKLLSILSNYELGHDFFVNYIGDSVYRITTKEGIPYKIESVLVLFLKRIIKLPGKSSKKEHFQKLKEELEQMDQVVVTHGLFNFMKWVDEKIHYYSS